MSPGRGEEQLFFRVHVLHNSTFGNSFGRRNRSSSNNDEARREVVGQKEIDHSSLISPLRNQRLKSCRH